jgi:hypothetical protein
MLQEIETTIAKSGKGEGNRVGALMRRYVERLRGSDPPPAAMGLKLYDSWQITHAAWTWETVSAGQYYRPDEDLKVQYDEYLSIAWDAYFSICSSQIEFEGDTVTRIDQPLRSEVCGEAWYGQLSLLAKRFSIAMNAATDDRESWLALKNFASGLRATSPPPAWAGYYVHLLMWIDTQVSVNARDVDGHWYYPPYIGKHAQFVQDAAALVAAYDQVCQSSAPHHPISFPL